MLVGFVIGFFVFTGIKKVSASVPEFDHADNCELVCTDWDWKWVCKNYWHSICLKWDKEKYCSEHELVCVTPEPEITPEVTPEPVVPTERPKPSGGGDTPVCVTDKHLSWSPTVTKAWKTKDCADIQWTPAAYSENDNAQKYNVYACPSGSENCKDFWNARDIQGLSYNFCELPQGVVDVVVCGQNACGEEKCSVQIVDDYTP